jgi:hypothetical protein
VLDHAVKNVVTTAGGVVSMLYLNVSLTAAVEEADRERSREPGPVADADTEPVDD